VNERWFAFASSAIFAVGPGAAAVQPASPSGGLGARNIAVEFTLKNGWVYDGRIELPAKDKRNGYAVMILGGGRGTPIDWMTPGELTIDHKPTRDADTIARALLDSGFTVMRWHAIRRDDPKNAEDPFMMDATPMSKTIEQANKAFAAFKATNVVTNDHVFLLGHSLGAWRASILLEKNPDIAGIAMLAGASLIPSDLKEAKKVLARARITFDKVDHNRDGYIDPTEWTTGGDSSSPDAADVDGDGKLSRHEWAVFALGKRADKWSKPVADVKARYGYRWPVDLIASTKKPVLLIVGELDERWLLESYLVTFYLRTHAHPDYTWKVYPNLGHNLAPEVAEQVTYKDQGVVATERIGPISRAVVADIVNWLKLHER